MNSEIIAFYSAAADATKKAADNAAAAARIAANDAEMIATALNQLIESRRYLDDHLDSWSATADLDLLLAKNHNQLESNFTSAAVRHEGTDSSAAPGANGEHQCGNGEDASESPIKKQSSKSAIDTQDSMSTSDSARRTTLVNLMHADRKASKAYHDAWQGNHYAARLLRHSVFECVSMIAIVLNAVAMTVFTDFAVASGGSAMHGTFEIEMGFLAFFMIELFWRAVAHGRGFFKGEGKLWRLLDFIVVISGLVDVIVTVSGAASMNVSIIRCLRVVKVLRSARLGAFVGKSRRVRLLLCLLNDIAGSLGTIVVLCTFLIYLFSGFFLQVMITHIESSPRVASDSKLMHRWGSTTRAMASLFASATAGEDWKVLADELLYETGTLSYALFLFFICFFIFFLGNVITATFVQSTMEAMQGSAARELQTQIEMEQKEVHIKTLTEAFGAEIDKEEWMQAVSETGATTHEAEQTCSLAAFRESIGVSEADLERIFSFLSNGGSADVEVRTFVVACILYKGPVTKLDVVELLMHEKELLRESHDIMGKFSMLNDGSLSNVSQITLSPIKAMPKLNIEVIQHSSFAATLLRRVTEIFRVNTAKGELEEFKLTLENLVAVVVGCKGGAGFVISTVSGYESLRNRRIDFQACDRHNKFPKGYMTEQTAGMSIEQKKFKKLIWAFTDQGDLDRWPSGHEAEGLPKDGFTLLSVKGTRRLCAARLAGLPTAPFAWDNVGTRHMAAMNAAWALRGHLSAVIVRSDTGVIHFFLYDQWKGLLCFKVPNEKVAD